MARPTGLRLGATPSKRIGNSDVKAFKNGRSNKDHVDVKEWAQARGWQWVKDDDTRKTLRLDGSETFGLSGIAGGITPGMDVACRITRADGALAEITLRCRIDTADEAEYYRHGGILHYVLRNMAKAG